MIVGDLFSGIGGFSLAARWIGWRTAWFSEVEQYPSRVLAKHWPAIPNHGDITQIDFATVEPVDLLCGGFPCQDISNAGKREGIRGERSGLWTHFARAIRELRPRYVVVENVSALLARGLDVVLGDLAEIGYDAEWSVLSAADVGAPHRRERVWIVAYPGGESVASGSQLHNVGPPLPAARLGIEGETMADAQRSERTGLRSSWPGAERRGQPGDGGSAGSTPAGAGPLAHAEQPGLERAIGPELAGSGNWRRNADPTRPSWWTVEPDVGRVANGIPARVDRLKGLGNAIVPRCAAAIFQGIAQREAARLDALELIGDSQRP